MVVDLERMEAALAAARDPETFEDVCALPLVRRVAAFLDQDPDRWRDGDALPRGWHIALFTVPTRQSDLRSDGVGGLGARLPDLGLPRIMAGGKRTWFEADIPIGAPVRRESRLISITPKEGRSGAFALVTIRHEIFAGGAREPVLVEEQDYVMRPAAQASDAMPPRPAAAVRPQGDVLREVCPDESMLFRYSAITFNSHRIHYDHPYATEREGYPNLVVNGGIPILFLVEAFKAAAGRQPAQVDSRNVAPLFCNAPIRLCATTSDQQWLLWAEDAAGRLSVELKIAMAMQHPSSA